MGVVLHHPLPRRRCRDRGRGGRDVRRAGGGARHAWPRSSPARCTPTPARCSPPCRMAMRSPRASPASCRVPTPGRPAAASRRAARTRAASASAPPVLEEIGAARRPLHALAGARRHERPLRPVAERRGDDLRAARGIFARGRPVRAVRRRGCRRWRAARRWASSARAAAARARSGRLLLGLLAPTAGARRASTARPLPRPGSAAWRRLRARMGIVFQDPFGSLDPRRSVGAQVADGLRIHGRAARGAASAWRRCWRSVGLDPAARRRLPARIQRRPAPAARHRARAGDRAGLPGGGRAGLRARRLDPGAGGGAAGGPAARPRPRACCSSATTCRWCAISATAWW